MTWDGVPRQKLGEQILGLTIFDPDLNVIQDMGLMPLAGEEKGAKLFSSHSELQIIFACVPWGALPMPGKPGKGSGVWESGQRKGRERAELPFYHTGNK